MKKETNQGEVVFNLAHQLERLDLFFSYFDYNNQIKAFLNMYKEAIYLEVFYRFENGKIKESFGVFDYLLDFSVRYLKTDEFKQSNGKSQKSNQETSYGFYRELMEINSKRSAVGKLIKISKKHGTEWVPKEFKKKVVFSLISLPILFVIYESMRSSIIAWLFNSKIEEFKNFIMGLYLVVAFLAFIQEQRTLKESGALVFNPYANLLTLALPAFLSGVITRIPRYITEITAVLVANSAQNNTESKVLAPVLAAIFAATLWTSVDIVFNFSQEKIYKKINNRSKQSSLRK